MNHFTIHKILFFLTIIIIIFLLGCTDTNKQEKIEKSIILIDESILIPPIASEESVVFYQGTIKNTGDETIDELRVIVKFYDDQDFFLGSKEDRISNMKSNEQRNFKVSVSNADEFFQEIDHVNYEYLT